MACVVVPLTEMEWVAGGHPLERKKAADAGVTLLEFAPGFADPNWCPNGHVILVLAGRLALELEDGTTALVGEGEACVIDPDTRHKARNPDDRSVRLFVFSPALAAAPPE